MNWLKKLFGGGSEKDKFAEQLAAQVKELSGIEVGYDAEKFTVYFESPDGLQVQLNLHNAYDEYLNVNVDERQVVFDRYARMLVSMNESTPEKLEETQACFLPRVQERIFYESMKIEILLDRVEPPEPSQIDWPYLPLAEHLAVGLVIDLPDSIRMINTALLNEWQTTFDDAYAIAIHNLRQISAEPMECIFDGFYLSPWRDNHDAARLVLTNKIREECIVEGDFLAFVPNRDHLFVTGTKEIEALTEVLDTVERLVNEPRPMHFVPLVLRGDNWQLYMPSQDDHEYDRIRELTIEALLSIYGENKEMLDAYNEKFEQDVFVGSYSAVQDTAGTTVMTYCVWTQDVVSALPRAEKVIFVKGASEADAVPVGSADFDRVLEVMSEQMVRDGSVYPERYNVTGFPTDAQFMAMGLCHM